MTLREWLDSYTHNGDGQLVCAWRKRAWRAMRPVVQMFVTQRECGVETPPGMLLQGIDAAAKNSGISPTTKRWRQEREKLVEILQGMRELWPAPGHEECGAVEVAIDLAEIGRVAEAAELLAAQAPNALNRKCRACGAKPGEPCFDGEAAGQKEIIADVRHRDGSRTLRSKAAIKRDNRAVPHLARVS